MLNCTQIQPGLTITCPQVDIFVTILCKLTCEWLVYDGTMHFLVVMITNLAVINNKLFCFVLFSFSICVILCFYPLVLLLMMLRFHPTLFHNPANVTCQVKVYLMCSFTPECLYTYYNDSKMTRVNSNERNKMSDSKSIVKLCKSIKITHGNIQ